jgi:hypothetical protein
VSESTRLRLAPSLAVKERRLAALLGGGDPAQPRLVEAVRDAQVLGSLELAGVAATAEEVRGARGGDAPGPAGGLYRALTAVDPLTAFSPDLVLTWHREGHGGGAFRAADLPPRPGPAPAPAAFIRTRIESLQHWLATESGQGLKPAERGALTLARLVEIAPFEAGNGRVARLAASHVMVGAGARPPVLVGTDGPRLQEALRHAFELQTGPLVALLEEASERALDVQIRALEAGPG